MQIEPALSPGDQPLRVRAQGSDRVLQAGPSYRIGRDPDSDVVVADPRVSWQHAVLRHEQDHWLLEDSGSTNGTFVGTDRVQRVTITGDCQLRLGHPDDGPVAGVLAGERAAGGPARDADRPVTAAPAGR